jgi:hypothetical protein
VVGRTGSPRPESHMDLRHVNQLKRGMRRIQTCTADIESPPSGMSRSGCCSTPTLPSKVGKVGSHGELLFLGVETQNRKYKRRRFG